MYRVLGFWHFFVCEKVVHVGSVFYSILFLFYIYLTGVVLITITLAWAYAMIRREMPIELYTVRKVLSGPFNAEKTRVSN